jgi:protein involved in polysaccharide export with SLBB domain
MRGVLRFAAALIALALAGCMHQQQSYFIVDPATGQPVPVVQQYQQPQYASGTAAQAYQQPAPQNADSNRGLFSSSPATAQQSYAQTYTAPTYARPAAVAQPQYAPQPAASSDSNRGLFSWSRSTAPAYAAPAYPQQTYPATTYPPQTYAAQPAYQAQPAYAAPKRYAAPTQSYAYAAPVAAQPAYTLDSGDKLRVVVFGQDGITNSYIVGADGNVNLPLVGAVPARGFTTAQLSQMISERLKQGYVREPHVSVEVETYRPFFILGEVTTPGQYPYVANMTAETAIAIAGGFSPRADKRQVELTRNAPGQTFKGDVPLSYPVRPGDTIQVKERWF